MNIKNKGKFIVFLGATVALAVSLIKDKKDNDNVNVAEEEIEK